MSDLISLHNRIGYNYLYYHNNPPIYNGGLLGQILSDVIPFVSNGTITSFTIGTTFDINRYIYEFFLNRSRIMPKPWLLNSNYSRQYNTSDDYIRGHYTSTVMDVIFVLLVIFTVLLPILFWIIWNFTKYHPAHHYIVDKFQHIKTYLLSKCQSVRKAKYRRPPLTPDAMHSKIIKIQTRCQLYKSQMSTIKKRFYLSIILWIILIFIFSITFIFHLTSLVDSDKMLHLPHSSEANYTKSFLGAWKLATANIDLFFEKALINSHKEFTDSLKSVASSLTSSVRHNVQNMTFRFMEVLGVHYLFNTTNSLIINLNLTVISMNYIRNNARGIISEIDIYKGTMDGFRDVLRDDVEQLCISVSGETLSQCLKYKSDINQLRVNINTTNINTESSVNMQFILIQFNLNISELNRNMKKLEDNINKDIIKMTDSKVTDLKLDSSILSVSSAWQYINTTIYPWRQSFKILNIQISSVIIEISIIFILFSSLFILIPIIGLVTIYIWILYKLTYQFFLEHQIIKSTIDISKNQTFNSVLDNYKAKRKLEITKAKFKLKPHYIYVYFTTFSVITILTAIFAIFFCLVTLFIYNEICIQYNSSEGQLVADNILNNFMNQYWNVMISNFDLMSANLQLNLKQPHNILSKLKTKCINSNGILYALEFNDLFNISSLLWNDANMNTLKSGLNSTYDALVGLDISNFLSSDITSLFTIAKNITQYFDKIDYVSSIEELSKPLINLPSHQNWTNEAIQFFSTFPPNYNRNNVLKRLLTLQETFNNKVTLEMRKTELGDRYRTLQDHRQNNQLIISLLDTLSKLKQKLDPKSPYLYNIVVEQYNQVMIQTFPKQAEANVTTIINRMLRLIFPCQDLVDAVKILVSSCCQGNSMTVVLTSYGLNSVVLTVSMVVIFHLGWWICRQLLNDQTEIGITFC